MVASTIQHSPLFDIGPGEEHIVPPLTQEGDSGVQVIEGLTTPWRTKEAIVCEDLLGNKFRFFRGRPVEMWRLGEVPAAGRYDGRVCFYLDEDQPLKAAAIGRSFGLDVIATEECGRKGSTDESQLQFAAEQGRVLATRNYKDFDRLTRRFMAESQPHAGILMVSSSLASADFAGIAEALLAYDQEHPGGMPPYAIDYLVPVRR